MATPVSAGRLFQLTRRTLVCCSSGQSPTACLLASRCYVTTSAGKSLRFQLDERTAHSSLELFEKKTGVVYRVLGLDPSRVPDNPERFRDWAVVLGDEKISSGRRYWEVTVKKSQEFRLGVAEALTSREDCVGANGSSWVFGYARREWSAMTRGKVVPVALAGRPERVGILLDYEAGLLGLVDTGRPALLHSIRASFRGPLCPAFALWDGELLTHSDVEEPEGLS